MDNTTKEIMIQGKETIIIYAFDILEEKAPSLKINPKDYVISVWANKTEAFVKFERRIRFFPIGSTNTNYEYDITVNLINKNISPFEDWSYNENESPFFIPSQQEKEKIEFVKKHAPLGRDGFIDKVQEEKNHYSVSSSSKYAYSYFKVDKITGEESSRLETSYTVGLEKPPVIDKDPIREIYNSTTKKEILEIISIETNPNMDEFIEITDILSIKEFEKIKTFILSEGDRRTYRNIDNDNPHYHFDDFHVYLNSGFSMANLNNDPKISDFREITIQDWNESIIYYTISIVRKREVLRGSIIKNRKKEGVYLLNRHKNDLNLMLKNLKEHYLIKLRDQINTNR